MDKNTLLKDLANDYKSPELLELEYGLTENDWQELYADYIQFPILKNNLGHTYVANEIAISKALVELKRKFSLVESKVSNSAISLYYVDPVVNSSLVYIDNSGNQVKVDTKRSGFTDSYCRNFKTCLEEDFSQIINIESFTNTFKKLTQGIVDFHPVQGENMFRASELSICNFYERKIDNTIPPHKIETELSPVIKLLSFKSSRDEMANLLLSLVVKYHLLKVAPFHFYSEEVTDLLLKQYLANCEYHFPIYPNASLISKQREIYLNAMENVRNSYGEADLTYFILANIQIMDNYLFMLLETKRLVEIGISNLNVFTRREQEYFELIVLNGFRTKRFNWESINEILEKQGEGTTKAGVLKILNKLEEKDVLRSHLVGRSKIYEYKHQ